MQWSKLFKCFYENNIMSLLILTMALLRKGFVYKPATYRLFQLFGTLSEQSLSCLLCKFGLYTLKQVLLVINESNRNKTNMYASL